MTYKNISISALKVNRANDRHGELEDEATAIAWLFNNRETHMRNLTKDIVDKGEIYEPPLVSPDGATFIVFDGNRRVTCLKLLHSPRKAPTIELQKFFHDMKAQWKGTFPEQVICQVENNRDRIDDILFRRHTGTQNGIGQSTWDDRMKSNFVYRTGKGEGFNVADEVEKKLSDANLLPVRGKIPRSTLNRLLSAEAFRNRVGFSVNKGRFAFTHKENVVLKALSRIANDLATKQVVLGDIWDVDGKRKYLDELEASGILPNAASSLTKIKETPSKARGPAKPSSPPAHKTLRTTLVPNVDYAVAWAGRLQRHRAIWEELQFKLHLVEHPNAISVLFRVLLELSVENYIAQVKLKTVYENDKLAKKALKISEDLFNEKKIEKRYFEDLKKLQNTDQLFSIDALHRYVHSPNLAPSPEHLTALWDTLADFIVHCLNA